VRKREQADPRCAPRNALKKLAADEIALLKLLHRWREEAEKAGRRIERTAVV
jgi:transposase